MAQQNYFSNLNETNDPKCAINGHGVDVRHIQNTISMAAGDDNNSNYLMARKLPSSYKFRAIDLEHDAIANGTDFDMGFANSETGEVLDKDCLMDGQTLAVAATRVAPKNGMSALTHELSEKAIWEILGYANPYLCPPFVDMILTGNVVGDGGKVTVRIAPILPG